MQNSLVKSLSDPLAKLYTAGLFVRKFLYRNNILKSQVSALPTFCVGNVVLGGSGKTPFTAYLTQILIELGYNPAILLRGYKGKEPGPKLVEESDQVQDVGDEALLHLKNNVPVIISRNRVKGVNFIKENRLANCVIMDDGLQHLAIKAQHNFLLLDVSDEEATKKWLFGKVVPAGLLREPLQWAVKRAHTVILVNKLSDEYPNVKFRKYLRFRLSVKNLIDLHTLQIGTVNKACNILCAIANPENFAKTVESIGLEIKEKFIFPDHHQVSEEEWSNINSKLPLIVSSKDAVKLKKYVTRMAQVFVLEQKGSICETSELKNILVGVMNAK